MVKVPRIILTPGEPAGIGPDLVVQIAQQTWQARLGVIADPSLLEESARQLKLPLILKTYRPDETHQIEVHAPGVLSVIPVDLKEKVTKGKLAIANANYVLETLELAAALCLHKKMDALVTGPVHKTIINKAGFVFSGHTEFLAKLAGVKHTVMLFVVERMKVALLTTHLALKDVSNAITETLMDHTLDILYRELSSLFNLSSLRILVAGLNPHAGEGGYLGREEMDIIQPVIAKWRKKSYDIEGPFSADTIFIKPLQQREVILGMYHDQVLPLIKYVSFGHAVNMTLGLPYIRTSVDHGTALHLAGKGGADVGSLKAALALAIELAGNQ